MRDILADVQVDPLALERAAAEQADIFYYWAREQAVARGAVDRASNALKLARAEADLNLRENPPTGLKITEAVIVSLVERDAEVRVCAERLLEKQRSSADVDAAVRAMEHRKSMISLLGQLQISGYYGDPTGTGRANQGTSALRGKLNQKQHE